MKLTLLSITRPILVIVLFVVLGILGLYSYTQMRYELLPNMSIPFIIVTTPYPGASPTEVELGLTKPIEDAVSSADRIKRVTSLSLENVSVVMVEFKHDVDVDKAQQDVQRKVNTVTGTLPTGAKTPTLDRFSLTERPVVQVAANSNLSDLELGTLLKTQIKPRLSQVAGVGQVQFVGLPEAEVSIALDAARLRALNLSTIQVVGAIRTANLNVPSGSVRDTDAAYSVRVVGKSDALDHLRDIVVYRSPAGQKVLLGDVASISLTPKELENKSRYMVASDTAQPESHAAVGILVKKQAGANNVDVSAAVRKTLTQLEQDYASSGLRFTIAQDGSEFTLAAATAVNHDLMLAIGLVALVMFVFLHSLRSSLIVMVAIPASLLSTFIFMNLLGFSLNLLTLLALSLVIGILVDDSIVVLESIYQRMEKDGASSDEGRKAAALNGRSDIGFAAIAITLVDVVVFVPLSFSPGLVGDLVREFSLVVVISTLFSLLVSFTLTPMIASRFGKVEHLTRNTLMGRFGLGFERQFARLSAAYMQLLKYTLHYRKTTVLITFGLFMIALMLPGAGFIGGEFMAPADKGEINVVLQFPEGYKLEQTDAMAKLFEKKLYRLPEVRRVFTNVGANPEGWSGLPTSKNAVEFAVAFAPRNERDKDLNALTREVKELAVQIPGARVRAYPLGLLGSDGAAPIVLMVSGSNRDVLRRETTRLTEAMRQIPGTADVRFSGNVRKPELAIAVDQEKLARYGLTTEAVGMAIRTALAGFDDLSMQQDNQIVTMRVRFAEAFRNHTQQMGQLTLTNAYGQPVELRQVATIRETFDPAILERKDRENSMTITSQAVGRPSGDIGVDIQKAVAYLKIDPSVQITYGGDLEMQDDSFGKLGLMFLAAIVFMYLVMVALYNSWAYPFVVLFSIPVALFGALFALALSMNSLNVFTILGLIMMLGLVAKNAILLVERTNENRERGLTVVDALLDAGHVRLRPILMTTLAMVIGMLPIALATGPGAEQKTGLAWALIGGLSSSMFLTLIFVPVVYYYIARLIGAKKKKHGGERRGDDVAPLAKKRRLALAPLAVVVLLLLGGNTLAQPVPAFPASSPSSFSLSLQDAANLVRQQNGEVRVARLGVQKAESLTDETRRLSLPTVNGSVQYQRNISAPVFFFPAFSITPDGGFSLDNTHMTPVTAALQNQYNAGLTVAVPLLQPSLRVARQQAVVGQKVAFEQVRAVTNRQVTDIKKLYLNTLLAKEQRVLLAQSIGRAEQALREVRNLYRAQLVTDADTLRAFVEVENLRPTLSKLDRLGRLLKGQLLVLTGLPANTDLVLTDSLTYPDAVVLAEESSIEGAYNQRPELRQLALGVAANELQAQLEQVRRRLTLNAFGQVGTLSQTSNFRFSDSRWPVVSFVGLQLNVPIFNAATAPKLQQARLAQQQAQEQLRYTKTAIANEVRSCLYALAEARDRILSQAGVVRAAERSYSRTESRYRQGIAKLGDLTDAELALRQAQTNRLQAIYDYQVAQVELERAKGEVE
ncbi:efflux RND transporter permease subunit [Fibrella forsythiae]|uniref:Efflux RND transporter permease subunit n=1 Tax=Fibrella forsythiae TaxID=2817061 RepID=A0ABS3JRG6_9BACT|nr:efflux RND transporter permease subunit [Fibrella forsythiae]MBO0952584.1 efflux RND transporter permease subunit [Fibrella forsythiae]